MGPRSYCPPWVRKLGEKGLEILTVGRTVERGRGLLCGGAVEDAGAWMALHGLVTT